MWKKLHLGNIGMIVCLFRVCEASPTLLREEIENKKKKRILNEHANLLF